MRREKGDSEETSFATTSCRRSWFLTDESTVFNPSWKIRSADNYGYYSLDRNLPRQARLPTTVPKLMNSNCANHGNIVLGAPRQPPRIPEESVVHDQVDYSGCGEHEALSYYVRRRGKGRFPDEGGERERCDREGRGRWDPSSFSPRSSSPKNFSFRRWTNATSLPSTGAWDYLPVRFLPFLTLFSTSSPCSSRGYDEDFKSSPLSTFIAIISHTNLLNDFRSVPAVLTIPVPS